MSANVEAIARHDGRYLGRRALAVRGYSGGADLHSQASTAKPVRQQYCRHDRTAPVSGAKDEDTTRWISFPHEIRFQ